MPEDFEQWVSPFLPTLSIMAERIGKLPLWMDKEDLLSQMVLDLWEKWKRGDLQDKTPSYIFRSCWFAAQNYLRKSKDKISLLSLDEPVDEEGTPFIELMEHNSSFFPGFQIRQGLDKLKEYLNQREQEVFHLQTQEYTTREIGQRLGISHVRVVKIQQHIRAKGKKIM